MTVAPPPASPERPSLETPDCKPDVLPRLRNIGRLHGENTYIAGTMADAINVISGLRESDARRLGEINRLKGELDVEKSIAAARLEGVDRGEALAVEAFENGAEAMRDAAAKACEATAKTFDERLIPHVASAFRAQAAMLKLMPTSAPLPGSTVEA